MPFQSQAQWRWAFATHQEFADRWAKMTPGGKRRFELLAKRKRTTHKHMPGKHNQASHGHKTPAGSASRSAYTTARADGATHAEALQAGKRAGAEVRAQMPKNRSIASNYTKEELQQAVAHTVERVESLRQQRTELQAKLKKEQEIIAQGGKLPKQLYSTADTLRGVEADLVRAQNYLAEWRQLKPKKREEAQAPESNPLRISDRTTWNPELRQQMNAITSQYAAAQQPLPKNRKSPKFERVQMENARADAALSRQAENLFIQEHAARNPAYANDAGYQTQVNTVRALQQQREENLANSYNSGNTLVAGTNIVRNLQRELGALLQYRPTKTRKDFTLTQLIARLKHMPGKHDQSSHGKPGRVGSAFRGAYSAARAGGASHVEARNQAKTAAEQVREQIRAERREQLAANPKPKRTAPPRAETPGTTKWQAFLDKSKAEFAAAQDAYQAAMNDKNATMESLTAAQRARDAAGEKWTRDQHTANQMAAVESAPPPPRAETPATPAAPITRQSELSKTMASGVMERRANDARLAQIQQEMAKYTTPDSPYHSDDLEYQKLRTERAVLRSRNTDLEADYDKQLAELQKLQAQPRTPTTPAPDTSIRDMYVNAARQAQQLLDTRITPEGQKLTRAEVNYVKRRLDDYKRNIEEQDRIIAESKDQAAIARRTAAEQADQADRASRAEAQAQINAQLNAQREAELARNRARRERLMQEENKPAPTYTEAERIALGKKYNDAAEEYRADPTNTKLFNKFRKLSREYESFLKNQSRAQATTPTPPPPRIDTPAPRATTPTTPATPATKPARVAEVNSRIAQNEAESSALAQRKQAANSANDYDTMRKIDLEERRLAAQRKALFAERTAINREGKPPTYRQAVDEMQRQVAEQIAGRTPVTTPPPPKPETQQERRARIAQQEQARQDARDSFQTPEQRQADQVAAQQRAMQRRAERAATETPATPTTPTITRTGSDLVRQRDMARQRESDARARLAKVKLSHGKGIASDNSLLLAKQDYEREQALRKKLDADIKQSGLTTKADDSVGGIPRKYGARAGEVITGNLGRDTGGKFARVGSNEGAIVRAAINRGIASAGGGKRGAKRVAVSDAQKRRQQADTGASSMDTLGFDASDYDFIAGDKPQDASDPQFARLIEQGLMDNVDGQAYPSALGRKIAAAAGAGDIDKAKELLARDRAKRTARQAKMDAQIQAYDDIINDKKASPRARAIAARKRTILIGKSDTSTKEHAMFGALIARLKHMPSKHDDITTKATDSYTPPAGVQAQAKRGLELRTQFGRGSTPVGIARARDLSNGKSVSRDTIMRMVSFFARHAVDKRPGWSDPSRPSNGYIAHLLWGGDAGRTWANSIAKRIKANE